MKATSLGVGEVLKGVHMLPSEIFLYMVALIGLGFALGIHFNEREAFRQYEQDRLARSRDRLNRVRG